ncbi:MAG: DUF4199 domain-containing protein [Schleiferiaceae bacterium]
MNPIVKKYAVKHGLIVGGIAALYTLIAYIVDPTLFVNWYMGIALMVVNFVILVMATVNTKKEQGGFINFKDAFSAFLVAALVGTLISTTVNIMIFNVVDPDFKEEITELTIEASVEMMENFGADEAAIEQGIAQIEENDQFSLGKQLQGVLWAIIGYAIVGLILAAITKKEKPVVDTAEIIDSED